MDSEVLACQLWCKIARAIGRGMQHAPFIFRTMMKRDTSLQEGCNWDLKLQMQRFIV